MNPYQDTMNYIEKRLAFYTKVDSVESLLAIDELNAVKYRLKRLENLDFSKIEDVVKIVGGAWSNG